MALQNKIPKGVMKEFLKKNLTNEIESIYKYSEGECDLEKLPIQEKSIELLKLHKIYDWTRAKINCLSNKPYSSPKGVQWFFVKRY